MPPDAETCAPPSKNHPFGRRYATPPTPPEVGRGLDLRTFPGGNSRPHAPALRTERLGFVPAVLIVWASGFLINLVLGAFLFQANVAFAVATGSLRHGDSRPWGPVRPSSGSGLLWAS